MWLEPGWATPSRRHRPNLPALLEFLLIHSNHLSKLSPGSIISYYNVFTYIVQDPLVFYLLCGG